MTEPTDEYLNELEGWILKSSELGWFIEGYSMNKSKKMEDQQATKFVIAKAIADKSERHIKYLSWIKQYSDIGWMYVQDIALAYFNIYKEELNKVI